MSDITELTIDALARRTGMTVRNVRAHQSRGLLPPPQIRGRTGYYGEEHVARLELVKELQAEGFNLEAIRRIIDRAPDPASLLDFSRTATAPFAPEEPVIVELREFTERWGDQVTPEQIEKISNLGIGRPVGEGRWELPSPALDRAMQELADLGVPLATVIDLADSLKRHSEAVSRRYIDLFITHVWRPFREAGEPEEQWPEVQAALERLRPLAAESLVAVFGAVMTQAVERAFEREVESLGRDDRATARRRRAGSRRR